MRYDARSGYPIADFSWEGADEGEERSGRGWARFGTAGRRVGQFFITMATDPAPCASLGE